MADIITEPRIHRGYPAEKPSKVSEKLVSQSSNPGDLVADPFMGSGSVAEAALQLGRRFTGTDLNPDAVRHTSARLAKFGAGIAPELGAGPSDDLLSLMGTQS